VIEEHRILPLADVALPFEEGMHPWHKAHETDIMALWAREIERRPFLFNGDIVMHFPPRWEGDVLAARSRMANFACLIYWLAQGGKEESAADDICHFFGSPVLLSSDGAAIMVRMSAKTANPGQVYAPCGSLDASDVFGNKVDLHANMAREVAEETGLDLAGATPEAGMHIYRNGGVYTCFRRFYFSQTAREIERRVKAHLEMQSEPEIDGLALLYDAEHPNETIPEYMRAFLRFHFAPRNEVSDR